MQRVTGQEPGSVCVRNRSGERLSNRSKALYRSVTNMNEESRTLHLGRLLTQFEALDLARRGFWQHRAEFDPAREFEGGEVFAAMLA
jgi:hypothetical protein